jgi:hypothetical protein
MNRDLVQVTAMITMAVLSVSLVAGPLVARHRDPAPAPAPAPVAATTVTLPACDDDAPGRPVTGPCWLIDDGPGGTLVRVFAYPYAPEPLYVLAGSGELVTP